MEAVHVAFPPFFIFYFLMNKNLRETPQLRLRKFLKLARQSIITVQFIYVPYQRMNFFRGRTSLRYRKEFSLLHRFKIINGGEKSILKHFQFPCFLFFYLSTLTISFHSIYHPSIQFFLKSLSYCSSLLDSFKRLIYSSSYGRCRSFSLLLSVIFLFLYITSDVSVFTYIPSLFNNFCKIF